MSEARLARDRQDAIVPQPSPAELGRGMFFAPAPRRPGMSAREAESPLAGGQASGKLLWSPWPPVRGRRSANVRRKPLPSVARAARNIDRDSPEGSGGMALVECGGSSTSGLLQRRAEGRGRSGPEVRPVARGTLFRACRDSPFARKSEELKPVMMIYVGNLDYAVTSDDLRGMFDPFGAVTLAEVQVKSGWWTVPSRAGSAWRDAQRGRSQGGHRRDERQGATATAAEGQRVAPRRTVRDLYAGGGWGGGGGGFRRRRGRRTAERVEMWISAPPPHPPPRGFSVGGVSRSATHQDWWVPLRTDPSTKRPALHHYPRPGLPEQRLAA